MVIISGKLFTGRDAIHKYLHEGNPSPVDLNNQIIYHCGPVVLEEKDGYRVVAAGPTTFYSGRAIPMGDHERSWNRWSYW